MRFYCHGSASSRPLHSLLARLVIRVYSHYVYLSLKESTQKHIFAFNSRFHFFRCRKVSEVAAVSLRSGICGSFSKLPAGFGLP